MGSKNRLNKLSSATEIGFFMELILTTSLDPEFCGPGVAALGSLNNQVREISRRKAISLHLLIAQLTCTSKLALNCCICT